MVELLKDGTTYSVTLKPDSRADTEATLKIGGEDQAKFIPNINISKWNDEHFVNFNAVDFKVNKQKESLIDNVVATTIGDVKHEMWPLSNESALEYQLTFGSRPSDTVVLDVLCSAGLKWNYQPPLTQTEIDNGYERPDNVVGSYAIYGSKQGNKYRAGKFGHVFRWKLTDGDENWAWAEQEVVFSEKLTKDGHRQGSLTITLPSAWMDSAVYPVRLMGDGDTFGIEAEGNSSASIEWVIQGCVDTPEVGTATNISASLSDTGGAGSHDVNFALYKDSDDSLLGQGTPVPSGSGNQDWQDMAVDIEITAVPTAIVAWGEGAGGAVRLWYDAEGGEGRSTVVEWTDGDYPETISWDDDPVGNRYSIHCDYEAGGGAEDLEINIAQTLAFTESLSVLYAYLGINVAETVAFGESLGEGFSHWNIDEADPITFAEVLRLLKDIMPSLVDTVAFGEALTMLKDMGIELSDTLTIGEVLRILKDILPSLADTITFGEAVTILKDMGIGLADTLPFSEVLRILKDIRPDLADTIAFTEALTMMKDIGISLADTFDFTEDLTATKSSIENYLLDLADTLNFLEAVTILKDIGIAIADTFGIDEAIRILKDIMPSLADTFGVNEVLRILKDIMSSLADTFGLDEALTISPLEAVVGLTLALADTFGFKESLRIIGLEWTRIILEGINTQDGEFYQIIGRYKLI